METTETPEVIDPTTERINRLRPLVQQILSLIADSKLPIGNNTPEEEDVYFPFSEKVLALLLTPDMKYVDKDTLFQLVLQPIEKVKTIVLNSLNKSMNTAMDLKFGKSFTEITMQDLDETIKSQPLPAEKVINSDIPVA